jgi:hypothetical protein
MKFSSFFAAVLFAGVAISSVAHAGSDKAAPQTASPQIEKTAVTPHSHVQEKTGVLQSAPEAKTDKPNVAQDKSKHNHPRDMK